ncbi:hypothetical protein [Ekhidna sp.]|uniref:hypothetical protein n=1 Tax=Ekhidna sp. TaxID=2608089 RepID=UPI003B5B862D
MKHLFTLALLILSLFSQAQNVRLSKSQVKANLIPLAIAYEGKVNNTMSYTISGGMIPSILVENYTSGFEPVTETFVFLHPYITSSFRSYYARNKVKEQDLMKNSGNYIGMFHSHQFAPFGSTDDTIEERARNRETNVFVVGPVWGLQRNYASGIHLDFSIGLGYKNGEYISGDVSLIGGFELGFILFSK